MHTIGSYKNNPTITLSGQNNDKFPFTFGLAKARLVLENIEAIKKFVKEHEPKQTAPVPATANN